MSTTLLDEKKGEGWGEMDGVLLDELWLLFIRACYFRCSMLMSMTTDHCGIAK